jgi:hypothetical protein
MPTDTPSPEAMAAALVQSIVARNGFALTAEQLAPLIQAIALDLQASEARAAGERMARLESQTSELGDAILAIQISGALAAAVKPAKDER